jgi:predicted RNA-binding protein YlxR (DUF448 family)
VTNVHHLPSVPAARALTLARAIQPGYLDRILADERRKLTALDKGTDIIDELAAVGRAVWVHRDAEARAEAKAEQAIRHAVRLEQTVGEVERIAEQWTHLHDGVKRAMGHLLLDVIRGDRSDDETAS